VSAPSVENAFLSAHANLLIESLRRLTNREPIPRQMSIAQQAQALWEAPFVVASHGTESDPIFNYANRTALALWEATWVQFTALPSRLSAQAGEREERERLLAEVNEKGFIDHYGGVRVTLLGKRFRIERAVVWSVMDDAGRYHGQAVMFRDWQFL
jgi:hypothetical protein